MDGKSEGTSILDDEPHVCTDFYKDRDNYRCKTCDKFTSPLSDCCGAPLVVRDEQLVCWRCGVKP